jgi:histone H3/H4
MAKIKNKGRAFSLYDIEVFLKDAGAEKINENAIDVFEKELEDTVNEVVKNAKTYANYAGRKRLIKKSDVELISSNAFK